MASFKKAYMLNVSCANVCKLEDVRLLHIAIVSHRNFKRIHFKRQYFHEHLMRVLCVNVKAIEIVISTLSFHLPLSLFLSFSCNETEYLFESAINLLLLGRMSLCLLRCVKMVLSTSKCRSTISASY